MCIKETTASPESITEQYCSGQQVKQYFAGDFRCSGANARQNLIIDTYKTNFGRCPESEGFTFWQQSNLSSTDLVNAILSFSYQSSWKSDGKPYTWKNSTNCGGDYIEGTGSCFRYTENSNTTLSGSECTTSYQNYVCTDVQTKNYFSGDFVYSGSNALENAIINAYLTYFGRYPELGGFNWWAGSGLTPSEADAEISTYASTDWYYGGKPDIRPNSANCGGGGSYLQGTSTCFKYETTQSCGYETAYSYYAASSTTSYYCNVGELSGGVCQVVDYSNAAPEAIETCPIGYLDTGTACVKSAYEYSCPANYVLNGVTDLKTEQSVIPTLQHLVCSSNIAIESSIIDTYKTYLGRCPDEHGLMTAAESGLSPSQLASLLTGSPEGTLWNNQGKPDVRLFPDICGNNYFLNPNACIAYQTSGVSSNQESGATCDLPSIDGGVSTTSNRMPDCPVNYSYDTAQKTCVNLECPSGTVSYQDACVSPDILEVMSNSSDCELLEPVDGNIGYYCKVSELNECGSLNPGCTKVSEQCIGTNEITGSENFGECEMWEEVFTCPNSSVSNTVESCSYEPVCFNGNCFTPENKCTELAGDALQENTIETCEVMTKEEINKCPVVYQYDKNGKITGAEVDTNSCSWASVSSCQELPIKPGLDFDGDYIWPTEVSFSCLGDTLDVCQSLEDDANCQFQSEVVAQYALGQTRPISVQKTYACSNPIYLANDTCTQDFAKMAVAMESSRQAGEYLDLDDVKVFGGEDHRCDRRSASVFGGSVGSKSCCNISAPDPESNNDVLAEAKASITTSAALALVDYSVDTGSTYVYDYMMDTEAYQAVSAKLMGAANAASTTASQADMLAEQTSEFSSASYGVSYAGIGIAYTGTATAAGTTVAGGATGTSSMSLGGGFQLQFNPIGLYLYAAIKLYQAYQAALACDDEDYKTATLSKGKLCYPTKSFCAKKESGLFGSTCVKYRTNQCCFNSKLARIINEQGRVQLGLDIEDCDGFTLDQLEALDWSKIDLSEFIADMLEQAQDNLPSENDLQRLNDKVISNVNTSSSGDTQPIDLGVNDNRRTHN